MRRRLLLLFAVAAAPLVPWSQSRIDALEALVPEERRVLYWWSGETVKRLMPGFESIAADVYWLRTVQYYGGERRFASQSGYPLLLPLIDATVTLDPRLEIAYRYGAIFLCEAPPDGAGRPREGIALLERGARSLPDSWRIVTQLGFFQFLFLHDAAAAASVLDQASRRPGAPFWFRTMAADLLAKGGDRAAARRMWLHMYEGSETGVIRENARQRLLRYDSLDAADQLTRQVAAYEKRYGRRPKTLAALRAAGLLHGPLTDRALVPFVYDGATGQVSIARRSPLWRPE